MGHDGSDSIEDVVSPLTLAVTRGSQSDEARDGAEIASLLTPVISECVSAASTFLAPPPQGEMAVGGVVPGNQQIPLVNSTCMKATCGGALLLAGLAGYAARTFAQAPSGAPDQGFAEASQWETVRPSKPARQNRKAPRPVVRLLEEECDEKPTGMDSMKKNEILTIGIGQGGIRVNNSFWEEMMKEHNISFRTRKYDGDTDSQHDDLGRCNVYFEEKSSRFVPRAILVDLEPASEAVIKSSRMARMFRPENMAFGKTGSSHNWAKGHYTEGAKLIDEVMDIVRKEAERCDCPQGSHIIHTLGGGTGSGMGTLLLMKLKDGYPDLVHSTFSIFPSPKLNDDVHEPYNAVLTCNQLLENADSTFVIDNEALYDIERTFLKARDPKMDDYNKFVARVMMGVTAPFRFQGVDDDLRKQNMSLVPFPRLKFLNLGHSDLADGRDASIQNLISMSMNARQTFANIKPADGKHLAASFTYRGPDGEEFTSQIPKFQSKDQKFVEWIPDGFISQICRKAPTTADQSCTMVSNHTSMKGVFQSLATQFRAMYKRKAFFHWYGAEGLDAIELQEADKNVRDLIQEYQDKQKAVVVQEEDDDDDEGEDDDDGEF